MASTYEVVRGATQAEIASGLAVQGNGAVHVPLFRCDGLDVTQDLTQDAKFVQACLNADGRGYAVKRVTLGQNGKRLWVTFDVPKPTGGTGGRSKADAGTSQERMLEQFREWLVPVLVGVYNMDATTLDLDACVAAAQAHEAAKVRARELDALATLETEMAALKARLGLVDVQPAK